MGEIREHRTRPSGRLYQTAILRGLRLSALVICVSNTTRLDVQRIVGGNSAVVHNPVGRAFDRPRRHDRTRDFVVVAPPHWRKNRLWAVEFWLLARRLPGFAASRLHIVGGALSATERVAVEGEGAQNAVMIHSGVSDDELNAIYGASFAVIQPSLHEGFGWPVVEGQSAGTPAICIDTPINREIGGEAAIYLPPELGEESAHAAVQALIDHRAAFDESCARNVARFSQANFDTSLRACLSES
ncbi:glycosyltransferase [Nocardioides alkalitolerans]|uniref:glycosyltransferase n=1 Tax=Nocardioides alkalitolerans TaxID=281714 RepID=UPI003CCBB215